MKVAVIGSRTFTDRAFAYKCLDDIDRLKGITCVVSGGARGADSIGEDWAKAKGKETKIFIPDWDRDGRAAGFIRNRQIVASADVVLAFWDGTSKGTKHSIDLAISSRKKIITYVNGEVVASLTKTS